MKKCFFYYSRVLLFLLLLGSTTAFAQGNKVTGTITDESGVPLIGANVIEVGTQNGVTTDFDGKFEINLQSNKATLSISSIGYETKQVAVAGGSNINITVAEDASELDEVVVIGYGSVKKRDVIGAVGSVGTEQLNQRAPTGALEALQGRVSGVQIVQSNGEPGAGARIKIRGTSTFGSGTDPLYVVDGQPFDNIDFLNAADIETIDVLKDGASAAIYGSKAANGVVLITTKGGKEGKAEFNVDYVRTYGTIANKVPVSSTLQVIAYGDLRNGNLPGSGDPFNFTFQNQSDFQEEITRVAVRDRLNVSLRGGNETAKYYWNVGYTDQEGVIINTDFRRVSTKLNLDLKPLKWLTSSTRITLTADRSNVQGISNSNEIGKIFKDAVNKRSFQQIFELDGSLITRQNGGESTPVSDVILRDRIRNQYRANVFQTFQFDITKSLSYKTNVGVNFNYERFTENTPGTLDNNGNAEKQESQDLDTDWVVENYLSWSPALGDGPHNLDVIAGASAQEYTEDESTIRSNKGSDVFPTEVISTLNATDSFNGDTGTEKEEHSLASYFARAAYNYEGKYLFSATIRRDGSSRFGANNKWGNFPAAQVGWRFSDDLFKDSDIINNGLLRSSWAITGNERIGNYDSQTRYSLDNFTYNGRSGIFVEAIGDPNLKWEETEQFAVGLDLTLLKSRLNLNLDYYKKTTTDLLQELDLPRELPVDNFRSNAGSVENTGYELTISGTLVDTDAVRWTAGFNIAFNENKVLDLGNEGELERFIDNETWILEPGESIGNLFGHEAINVFPFDESNAFNDQDQQLQLQDGFQSGDTPAYTLNGQPYTGTVVQKTFNNNVLVGGDFNFADSPDENGVYDGNVNDDDKRVIGNGLPDYFGGFNSEVTYKNFSLSVFFDYSIGQDLYRDFDYGRNTGRFGGVSPSPVAVDNAWRQQGDNLGYPAFRRNTTDNRIGLNSFYIDDGSFIKLRNVRLGYTVPSTIASKLGMTRLSAYIAGNNLITWTNYQGYDPEQSNSNNALEVGLDDLQYPTQRELLIGLNLTF